MRPKVESMQLPKLPTPEGRRARKAAKKIFFCDAARTPEVTPPQRLFSVLRAFAVCSYAGLAPSVGAATAARLGSVFQSEAASAAPRTAKGRTAHVHTPQPWR